MKKQLLSVILTITCCVSIVSCNKDKDVSPSDKIFGTWDGDKMYELEYTNGELSYADTTFLIAPDYFHITFSQDHVVTIDTFIEGDKNNKSGRYAIAGDTLLMTGTDMDAETGMYTFSINGNTLELVDVDSAMENNQMYKEEEHIFLTRNKK